MTEVHATLPTAPDSYLGVYTAQSPALLRRRDGVHEPTWGRPDVDMYYSGWLEPFQASFATTAARHGAVPLVQIDPTDVSLSSDRIGAV